MAVVAVFDIHIDRNAPIPPNTSRIRAGRSPTQGRDSTNSAMRRSSPWIDIARAIRNDPRNRKMIGCANGANAALGPATPSGTVSVAPRSAVAGRGIASVTQ